MRRAKRRRHGRPGGLSSNSRRPESANASLWRRKMSGRRTDRHGSRGPAAVPVSVACHAATRRWFGSRVAIGRSVRPGRAADRSRAARVVGRRSPGRRGFAAAGDPRRECAAAAREGAVGGRSLGPAERLPSWRERRERLGTGGGRRDRTSHLPRRHGRIARSAGAADRVRHRTRAVHVADGRIRRRDEPARLPGERRGQGRRSTASFSNGTATSGSARIRPCWNLHGSMPISRPA